MSKFLVYAKSLGNSNYTDYKKYLKTKSQEEIIELKADLKTKVEKWNKIISTFIIVIILSIITSLGKLTYDFIKNAYKLYPTEANVLVKGFMPIIVLLGLFFIILGIITYNNLYNAKKKLIFLEEFEKENEKKSNLKLEI